MGRFALTCRPSAYLPRDIHAVLDLADRYRKGVPPIAGGALDQAHWFTQAADFIDYERMQHLGPTGVMAMMYGC